MNAADVHAALDGPTDSLGDEDRSLRVGTWDVHLAGLDGALAAALDLRWGGFLREGPPAAVSAATIRFVRTVEVPGLGLARPGESYRVAGGVHGGRAAAWSFAFAVGARTEAGDVWNAAVDAHTVEPVERVAENVVRFVLARVAADHGGLALHAAGLLRRGRAWLFAGASGAGKTTLTGLSPDARSLGDDFAVVVPREGGFATAAVPFDNSERAPADPPPGWLPLAGIRRLYQADSSRVERLPASGAAASLMGCAALPWAMPDLGGRLLAAAQAVAEAGLYAHLHFALSPEFWERLDPESGQN